MKTTAEIITAIECTPARSAWARGVKDYATDLIWNLDELVSGGYADPAEITTASDLLEVLLNGAANWEQFSEGGCALCYNYHIAKRLCTPSEFRKTDAGMKDPNARESWIDVQARALYQAWALIRSVAF